MALASSRLSMVPTAGALPPPTQWPRSGIVTAALLPPPKGNEPLARSDASRPCAAWQPTLAARRSRGGHRDRPAGVIRSSSEIGTTDGSGAHGTAVPAAVHNDAIEHEQHDRMHMTQSEP